MFSRILVGLDKSEVSNTLMEHAIFLAKPFNACLHLVHVLTGNEPGYPELLNAREASLYYCGPSMAGRKQYSADCKAFVEEYYAWLEEQAVRARDNDIEAVKSQLSGMPGQVLCDTARKWGADLVLLGTHGRSGLNELLIGSVSNYVMHHAPCSVLVIHRNRLPKK